MFPDSEIAKKITCCPTKASSLSVFGLAPHFQGNLVAQLDEVPFYSISFDESYNKVTKNEHMDFSIRFWNNEKNIIVNRYFGSEFFGHGTASDLLDHFKLGTSKLQLKKITQISMDGPNVNLKFYRDFLDERQNFQPDIPIPIDIGSCGLHIIHGAFKTGFDETGWKIDNILRSLGYLFNDSPARRADYTDITSSMIFPLKFCGTRWIEDAAVADRAVICWENIKKYLKKVVDNPKSKIP